MHEVVKLRRYQPPQKSKERILVKFESSLFCDRKICRVYVEDLHRRCGLKVIFST